MDLTAGLGIGVEKELSNCRMTRALTSKPWDEREPAVFFIVKGFRGGFGKSERPYITLFTLP